MDLEKAVSIFGHGWVKELRDYLGSKEFHNIGQEIRKLRSQGIEVYPEGNLVFRAFTETHYEDVTVILLGQDVYPQKGVADGLAFSCSNSLHPQPSLKNMLIEVDAEYPEYKLDPYLWRLDQIDLTRWTKQGVFLLNSFLTVETGTPNSHAHLWRSFTIKVIEALNKKQDVVYLLLGNIAQSFEKHISTRHRIVSAAHPASESRNVGSGGFYGSNCFKQVNECLENVNLKPINW